MEELMQIWLTKIGKQPWMWLKQIELNLKCIAARAVRKFGLSHVGLVPKDVENLIISH